MNGNYILNLIKHVAVKNYDWKKCLLAISVSKRIFRHLFMIGFGILLTV